MNKTVNINLAGIFFHIDEDAYYKLQNYLEAIKRSLGNEQGRDEIIADIEARIAELFTEKKQDDRSVINTIIVDEVITVMGQPEDYHVDEELFESPVNTPEHTHRPKSLYRDATNSYAGGVCSGLGHYFGADPIWLRLAWILFTIFSGGTFILIYACLWILIPEAKTTADQLAMRGEPVTINTIERKIKEGFGSVSDSMKNADYKGYGHKVKNSSAAFFDTLGDILNFLIKIAGKIIGVFFVFLSGITLISMLFALFGITTFNITDAPWIDYVVAANIGAPFWLVSFLVFLVASIPFFFLFILGLKMLVKNLKSIGKPAKLTLLSIWCIALIAVIFLGIRQATVRAFDATVSNTETIHLPANDTLNIQMRKNDRYVDRLRHQDGFDIRSDKNDNKILVLRDIMIYIKPIKTNAAAIKIVKKSEGKSLGKAKELANAIQYHYEINDNTLLLDAHAITDYTNKYADQNVKITLFIPETMTILAATNTKQYNNYRSFDEFITIRGKEGNYLQITQDEVLCPSCPIDDEKNWNEPNNKGIAIDINDNNDHFSLKIDKNGIKINNHPKRNKTTKEDGIDINLHADDGENFNLKVDENGILINNKPVKVTINTKD